VAEINIRPVNEQSRDRNFIGINIPKKADHRPASEPKNDTILEIDSRVDGSGMALDADKAPKVHAKKAPLIKLFTYFWTPPDLPVQ